MSLRLAVTAAVLLAAAGALLVGLALSRAAPATRAEQVESIAAELRCPTCQALSVADSQSDAAAEMRRQIGALLDEGRSPDEVKRHFVDRYGEWILLSPTSPAAWVIPAAATLAALAALAVWLRRGDRVSPFAGASAGPAPDDRNRQRVRDELEALDA